MLRISLLIATLALSIQAAKKGEPCNGLKAGPCESGLLCVQEDPQIRDVTGLCYPEGQVANQGEPCGRFGRSKMVCNSNLECIISSPKMGTGICERKKAKEGEVCDQFSMWTRNCAEGLFCKPKNVRLTDVGGTCVKNTPIHGQKGGMCGGIAGIQCEKGLHCEITAKHPDASGRCVDEPESEFGTLGKLCGGIAGILCKKGLLCHMTTGNHPDASGICVEESRVATLGQTCGGKRGLLCKNGLVCEITAKHTDATGICRMKTAKPGQLGSICGGEKMTKCNRGLFCKRQDRSHSNSVGVCLSVETYFAQQGEICEGKEKIKCASGLKCKHTVNIFMDGYGTCQNSEKEDDDQISV